jgi:hypothetical protein
MLFSQPLDLGDQRGAFLRGEPLLTHSFAFLRQAFDALNARPPKASATMAAPLRAFKRPLPLKRPV